MSKNGTVDYSKGLIYKLCCKDTNITDIYVGSTTNMKNRKYQHKFRCNTSTDRSYNLKVYQFIRENGGWDNWDMVLVEYANCNSKQDLIKEERIVIELLQPTLNIQFPSRTNKEWRTDNKEYLQQYKEINKEKYKEHNKKHNEERKHKVKEQIECIYCKSLLPKYSLKKHYNTKKCKKFQNSIL